MGPDGLGQDCVRLGGSCSDRFACPVKGSSHLTQPNSATFHFTNGTLVPVASDGFANSYGTGDELEVVREGHTIVVDGQEHGIAVTVTCRAECAPGATPRSARASRAA